MSIQQGNICWSRQRDIQVLGQPLLKSQLHARLTSFIEEGKLKLVAVDVTDKRLIKLDGETGEVLMVTKLFDNGIEAPAEITHDGKQFLYVSHPVNKEIYFILHSENQCISKLDKIGIFIDMKFH